MAFKLKSLGNAAKKKTPAPGWIQNSFMPSGKTAAPASTSAPFTPAVTDATNVDPTQVARVNPFAQADYETAFKFNRAAYDNSNLQSTANEDNLASDTGFSAVHRADGSLDRAGTLAGGVDPNNPFSKMMLLSRAYQQKTLGTTNSYASQGQLYSSAINDERANDKFGNDLNVNETRKAFDRGLQSYAFDRLNNTQSLTQNNATAAQNLRDGNLAR